MFHVKPLPSVILRSEATKNLKKILHCAQNDRHLLPCAGKRLCVSRETKEAVVSRETYLMVPVNNCFT